MKAWLLPLALVALVGCGDNAKQTSTGNNSSGNPITAPVDYLGAVAKAKKTSVAVADLASLRQAIQIFKTEEERFPKDLNELVTKQNMPKIPAPPYQMKYAYNPANGNLSLVPAQ